MTIDRSLKTRSDLSPVPTAPREPVRLLTIALLLFGLLAFATSFQGQFVFDDYGHIVTAENIRRLWPISAWLYDNPRPVVTLSLAVNYAIGGLNPLGYHVVNLGVHLFAGVLLFGLLRRAFRSPVLRAASWPFAPLWLAFVIALLWMVHPLQTQSVTYVIQRSESMMGMFFILSAYCLVRGFDSNRTALWQAGSIVAFGLGMACKVAIVGGPLVLLAVDLLLFTGSLKEVLKQRWHYYLGLVMAAAVVFFGTKLHLSILHPDPGFDVTVGLGTKGLTPWQYFISQPGVVMHYLWLVFWPQSLCIDYGWGLPQSAMAVVVPAIPLMVMLLATLWGCWQKKPWALTGVWFFLLIGPSSSFVPVRDLIMEHRMYLPLAGALAAILLGVTALVARLSPVSIDRRAIGGVCLGLMLVIATALSARTFQRNKAYHSTTRLWAETLRVNPGNSRVWLNFGEALARENKHSDALEAFEKAAELSPKDYAIQYNLGNSYVQAGRIEDAERVYLKSIELKGDELPARIMLGNLYASRREDHRAEELFRSAIALETSQTDRNTLAKAHYNLANSLFRMVRPNDAFGHYQKAVEIDPTYDKARYGLGWILARFGRTEEAIREITKALEINPGNLEAREELDRLMQAGSSGRPPHSTGGS